MYGLVSQIIATRGKRRDLTAILAGIGPMPGCRSYVVANDPSDQDAVWVTEVWDSAEAHAASLELPEVQEAIGMGRHLIAEFRTRVETEPVAGAGTL